MATDPMDIDSMPASVGPTESEKERKRKHKNKDETSKKKRKHEKSDDADKKSKKKKDKSSKSEEKSTSDITKTTFIPDSPYSLTTATIYLPLSPISISPTHALASLLAEHLSPLLLTYFPPLQGIILAYSNASISSEPPTSPSATSRADPNPQPLTLAATAGEYGVMYVYLTATFLVFRPQRDQILEGWVNVQSEGFLGAVVLNLFSVGIERKRLPPSWKWIPPGEEDETQPTTTTNPSTPTSDDDNEDSPRETFDPKKEHFNPIHLPPDQNPFFPSYDQDTTTDALEPPTTDQTTYNGPEENIEGHFQSTSGHRVRGTIKFRVVDIDIIPGSERDRGFLSIEGTMLTPEEEDQVLEDERNGVLASSSSSARRATAMSGGIIAPVTVPLAKPKEVTTVDVELEHDAQDAPSKKPKEKKEKKSKSKSKSKGSE
ncbi:hypothetical protein BJX70DRAFT_343711 [Aspergillus crustosus]